MRIKGKTTDQQGYTEDVELDVDHNQCYLGQAGLLPRGAAEWNVPEGLQ